MIPLFNLQTLYLHSRRKNADTPHIALKWSYHPPTQRDRLSVHTIFAPAPIATHKHLRGECQAGWVSDAKCNRGNHGRPSQAVNQSSWRGGYCSEDYSEFLICQCIGRQKSSHSRRLWVCVWAKKCGIGEDGAWKKEEQRFAAWTFEVVTHSQNLEFKLGGERLPIHTTGSVCWEASKMEFPKQDYSIRSSNYLR